MSHVKRLGLGLGALIGNVEETAVAESNAPIEVSRVRSNPFQPRSEFDPEEMGRLTESIRKDGLLQPVVVRPVNGHFELVAGERRWRAAVQAGMERIPAVVRDVDDKKMLELALVENLQRRDLNPIEKARAFRQLMQVNGWTQEELAASTGLGRPTVANFLRLLELPAEIQEAVSRGTITMGHARALLAAADRGAALRLLKRIIQEDLSVRALEQILSRGKPASKAGAAAAPRDAYTAELERKLMDRLGVRVEIRPGMIAVRYSSNQELSGILQRLGVA